MTLTECFICRAQVRAVRIQDHGDGTSSTIWRCELCDDEGSIYTLGRPDAIAYVQAQRVDADLATI